MNLVPFSEKQKYAGLELTMDTNGSTTELCFSAYDVVGVHLGI